MFSANPSFFLVPASYEPARETAKAKHPKSRIIDSTSASVSDALTLTFEM